MDFMKLKDPKVDEEFENFLMKVTSVYKTMENSNYDCTMNHQYGVNEVYFKNNKKELKDGGRITAKNKIHHRSKKEREPMIKYSSNIEHDWQLENAGNSENGQKCLRVNDTMELGFCSRHDLESINNSTLSMKSVPKELIESIRKLPSEINAFLTESSFNVYRTEKFKSSPQKQSKTESTKKSRVKLTKDSNNISSQRKSNRSKPILSARSEEEPIKGSKSKIGSYFQNFMLKPQSVPNTPAKSKSSSNLKLNKNKNRCNQLKNAPKRVTLSKNESKHNLRVDYIEWLLSEKKFFNTSDPNCATENSIKKTKPEKEENATSSSQSKRRDQLKGKKSRRHHSNKTEKKDSEILAAENNALLRKKKPLIKYSDKNYGLSSYEAMTNGNVSPEQLHHIRWLASVENIIQTQSKEFIRRTISLNEFYSYIPTHDRENTKSILQSDNKEINEFGKLKKDFIHLNNESLKINDSNEQYHDKLHLTKITNNLEEALMQSHTFGSNINNEAISDVRIKPTSESIESISIVTNKSQNTPNSYESLNIEISLIKNEEDSLTGASSKGKVQDMIYNDKLILCNKSVNYTENSHDKNQDKPNFNCSFGFKTPTEIFGNNQETVKSHYCQNFKNKFNDIRCNSHQLDEDLTNEIINGISQNQCHSNYSTPRIININNEKEKNVPQLISNENDNISLSSNNNHSPLIKDTIRNLIMDKTDELTKLTNSTRKNFSINLKNKYSNKTRLNNNNSYNAHGNLSDDSSTDDDIIINRLVHKIKSKEKRSNKFKTLEKRFKSGGITEIFSEKSKGFSFSNLVTKIQMDSASCENRAFPDFREVKRANGVKITNNTAVQCDIQSSSSACSTLIPVTNRKRKYHTDVEEETECNNISDNVGEQTIIIQSNCSSLCSCTSKNDEKQNEILLVMTELSQKLNFIQDQISFMNINYNKCDNIEATLEKLKTDVSFGLKHVQNTLKNIENDNKIFEKTELKSEPNILIKTENVNERPKIVKSLDTLMKVPLNNNKSSQSKFFMIDENKQKIFYNVLNNLTHQLKRLTSKEGKLDGESQKEQNIKSKEIGLMTDENPVPCNYCCLHVGTSLNKSEKLFNEKDTECDLNCKQSESINEKANEKIRKETQYDLIDKQNEAKSENIQCIEIYTNEIMKLTDNTINLKNKQINSDLTEMKKKSFKIGQSKLKTLKSKLSRPKNSQNCVIF